MRGRIWGLVGKARRAAYELGVIGDIIAVWADPMETYKDDVRHAGGPTNRPRASSTRHDLLPAEAEIGDGVLAA